MNVRFLFITLLSLLCIGMHAFYVSTTEISHNAEAETLEITVKLFTHDFEAALEKASDKRLFLGDEKEHADADQIIEDYLRKHFEVKQGGKALSLKFVGKEVEIHDTWCYLEASSVSNVQDMEIMNTVLLELFEKQTNTIHLISGKKRASLTLHKGFKSGKLSLE